MADPSHTPTKSPPQDLLSVPTPLAPTRSRVRHQTASKSAHWTDREDSLLRELKTAEPNAKWVDLVCSFPAKNPHQLKDRWEKVLDPGLVKGSWTGEEDALIVNWVKEHGTHDWGSLAAMLTGRISKQCRERWHNHLSPAVLKGDWTIDEDSILIDCHQKMGNKWSQMTAFLPGRTDNAIKNRWNSSIKRRLERIQNGQDPLVRRGRRPKRPSEPPPLANDDAIGSNVPQKEDVSVDGKPPVTEIPKSEVSSIIIPPSIESAAVVVNFSPSQFSPSFGAMWSPGVLSIPWGNLLSPKNGTGTIIRTDLTSIPGPNFDDSLVAPKE